VFVRAASDDATVDAEAAWEGRIGFGRRGAGGFGFDPLFIVADGDVTAAEMSDSEKNRMSHRAQALAELAAKMALVGW
jgi:XTP/dITP diphosphohydrolase